MGNRNKILSALSALVFCTTGLFSQYKFLEPVPVSKEQGLPTNDIRAVTKSKDGFMWLGSVEGLCRFDGQQVKVYKPGDIQNPVGAVNAVHSLLAIDDKIWMGTNQGVSVLNTHNDSFRHYIFREADTFNPEDSLQNLFYEPVSILYRDRQGTVWAGTRNKGVWRFDSAAGTFKSIRYPAESYPRIIPTLGTELSVLSLEQSMNNDSIIWAGTTAGLEKINKYTGKVEWYTFPRPQKDYQVSLNVFRRLYSHDDGLIYVGSWGAGMNVFDPVKKTFTPLSVNFNGKKPDFKGGISGLQRKSSTEIWVTSAAGLSIYNTQTKSITGSWLNVPEKGKWYGVNYIDDAGRIWCLGGNGVLYFDRVTQQFAHYDLTHLSSFNSPFSFYVKSDETGEVVTVCPRITDALFKFDKSTQEWTRYPFNGLSKYTKENLIVRGFEETEPGEYLISTDNGLFTYSIGKKNFSRAHSYPAVKYDRWGDILKDRSGFLWICADADGIIRLNKATGEYRIFKEELNLGKVANSFVRARAPYEDSRGNIWFARADGFSVYLAREDSMVNFTNQENTQNTFQVVYSFAEDKGGRIWLNSDNGWYGYIRISDPLKGIVRKFNLKERNIDGVFLSLATDKQGNVWGYTNRSMIRINAGDLSYSTFSFEYGVKDPEFYNFSFLPSGEILFGDRTGITMADIDELQRNKELPVPYISQLNLLNRPVNASFYAKSLQLNYRQNFITIFFSAKAYTVPKGTRFRYRLKDFEDWNEVEGSQFANYTNIPPGNYTFQLQAANNEGVWNPAGVEMPVQISTPWFQTWWFRIAVLLTVTGMIYSLYRYRIGQIRKKEKLKTQYEKKLANVEMTALLAQMNPHFLFNSLNSIDSYIIKNESGKASEYLNNFARLMRLILQNSRSNYISLKDELEALDLYLQMEGLRFKDKFQYEIKVAPEIDSSSVLIPPMLIQPYVENAIWHGLMHKKDDMAGKVTIEILQHQSNLICVVEDNGIGREKAEEIKARKPGNHKRSMGMQITRDRIDMINKLYNTNTQVKITDLKKEEDLPAGTRVELIIPF